MGADGGDRLFVGTARLPDRRARCGPARPGRQRGNGPQTAGVSGQRRRIAPPASRSVRRRRCAGARASGPLRGPAAPRSGRPGAGDRCRSPVQRHTESLPAVRPGARRLLSPSGRPDSRRWRLRRRCAHRDRHAGAPQRARNENPAARSEAATRILTGVPVWSHRLGLYGICDAIEISPGTALPVEHKIGPYVPDGPADVQAAAQVLCLAEMLGIDVPVACVFSHADRRRHLIQVSPALKSRVEELASAPWPRHQPAARPCSAGPSSPARITTPARKCRRNIHAAPGLRARRG